MVFRFKTSSHDIYKEWNNDIRAFFLFIEMMNFPPKDLYPWSSSSCALCRRGGLLFKTWYLQSIKYEGEHFLFLLKWWIFLQKICIFDHHPVVHYVWEVDETCAQGQETKSPAPWISLKKQNNHLLDTWQYTLTCKK